MKKLSRIALALAVFASASLNATGDANPAKPDAKPAQPGLARRASTRVTSAVYNGAAYAGNATYNGASTAKSFGVEQATTYKSFVKEHTYKGVGYTALALAVIALAGKGFHAGYKAIKAKRAAKNS